MIDNIVLFVDNHPIISLLIALIINGIIGILFSGECSIVAKAGKH